jgi:hypothetical protein
MCEPCADSGEPIPTDSSFVGSVACRRCGTVNTTGADACTYCHAFLPHNRVRVEAGLRTMRWPAGLEMLQTEVERFLDGSLVDEGDAPDVPTRRRALLEYRARLHRRIVQLDGCLELKGLFDGRGRLRTSWLTLLATLIDRAKALDQVLGLERRVKQYSSFAAAIEAHVAEQATLTGPKGIRDVTPRAATK